MARKVTFDIITRAQTDALKDLVAGIDAITRSSKKLNQTSANLGDLDKNLRKNFAIAKQFDNILGEAGKSIRNDIGKAAKDAGRDLATLESRMRDVNSEVGKSDRLRRKALDLNDKVIASEKRVVAAQKQVADAREEINRVQRDGGRSVADIERAEQAYKQASTAVNNARKDHEKLRNEFRETGTEIDRMERHFNELASVMGHAMNNPRLQKFVTPQMLQQVRKQADALTSLKMTWDQTGDATADGRKAFDAAGTSLSGLTKQLTALDGRLDVLQEFRSEMGKMSKLRSDLMREAIGNVGGAQSTALKALREQNDEAQRLRGSYERLSGAAERWRSAELAATNAVDRGTSALKEQQRVSRMFTSALSGSRGEETTLSKRAEQLASQQRNYIDQMTRLRAQVDAATAKLMTTSGEADYERAARDLERLRAAYGNLDRALDENTANIRQNEAAQRQARSQTELIQNSTRSFASTMASIRTATNPFKTMMTTMQQLNTLIMAVARSFASVLTAAVKSATNAALGFTRSVGSMFAGLQRALQAGGNYFTNFADKVQRSMDRARAATMEMYAAGFSLMMIGQQMTQFGLQGFRMMDQSLQGFMDYERKLIQASIASSDKASGFVVDTAIADSLIRDMQRGMSVPWVQEGRPVPVTFDATELAEGMYYYSSAIGVPINAQNRDDVGAQLSTIMQAAAVTNTQLETAIKGVMNVAMEFGYNPRDIASSDPNVRAQSAQDIAKISAQMAYLSNISTMEFSDIAETFKMLGPMAHVLSPDNADGTRAGAGLDETFLLTFLASEVGLRGGNVGRGINQMMTSLLDPTAKMLETTGEFFGEQYATSEGFRDLFFEGEHLRGGIQGLFETLSSIPDSQQAQMLAALFSQNATRSGIGVIEGFNSNIAGGLDLNQWLEEIRGDNPFEWLSQAAAQTANSVSGWFAFMTNGWFQFQKSIIGSVSGPLMSAFRLIGEFLFEFAEQISINPAIGQFIASLLSIGSTVAVVVGVIATLAGSVLLISRVFAMAGGYILPFVRLLLIAGATFLTLLPILAVIGIAIAVLAKAFQSDLLGMRTAWEGFSANFTNFDQSITPMVEAAVGGLARLAAAANEFIDIIVLGGDGTANNLFALTQRLLGPLLGNATINGLMALREGLQGTRDSISEMIGTMEMNTTPLSNFGLAIQGFFEQVFLGQQRLETTSAQNAVGRMFGLDNLSVTLQNASVSMRGFISDIGQFGAAMVNVWRTMGNQIYANLGRIFADGGLGNVFSSILSIVQNVAQGIIFAFTSILGGVVLVTDKIADFAQGLRQAEASGAQFMGMAVSFDGILRAIGTTIGLFLGARLALAFSPLAAMLTRIIPLAAAMASVVVGLGGRFVILAAQIAITTASYAAQAAIMAVLTAAKIASSVATMVFSTAQVIATGNMAGAGIVATALGFAITTLGAATFAGAGAWAIFTASASAALAVIIGLVAIVTVVVAAFFGFAAAVTALAGIMIVAVTATQGLGAGLAALQSFAMGVWSGLQFGIDVLATFIGWVQQIAGMIGAITGMGNAFAVMGTLVGASLSAIILLIVGLVSALAILAAAWVVMWIAANGPALIVITSLMLIAAAFKSLWDEVSSFGVQFDGFWDQMAATATLGAKRVGDAMVNGIIDAVNSLIDLGQGNDFVSGLINTAMPGFSLLQDALGDKRIPNVNRAGDYENELRRKGAIQGVWGSADNITGPTIELDTTVDDSGVMDFFNNIGMGDVADSYMRRLGLDPNNLSLESLTSGQFANFLNDPISTDMMEKYGEFEFDSFLTQYQKDLAQWETFQQMEKDLGSRAAAVEFFEMQGWSVPSGRPEIMDYLGGMAGDIEGSADAIEEQMNRINEAFGSLKGMSMEDYLGAVYDPLAGAGGKSIASWLAGGGAQSIIGSLPEGSAPWMNDMELMADVAGTGLDMGANVYGQNIHDTLTPYLSILSEQTGVEISTMLADIPKFIAPEEFMGIGAGDLLMGISELGPEMFRTLDTLGTDMFDAMGNPMEEYGLEWAELQAYGVGQAVAGTDWNLADYLSESWGISVSEAEAYLASHGIDPEVISDATFEATEAAALTGNGAFSAMTEEMYNFLAAETANFTTDVISMTEEEWAAIPPAYKAVMANMGITTIIEEGLIPPEAKAAAQAAIEDFGTLVQSLGTYLGKEGANFQMEGDPSTWLKVGEFRDATGQVITVLQDLDGTQVHVPAADVDDYIYSVELLRGVTEDAIAALKRANEYARQAMNPARTAQQRSGDYTSSLDQLRDAGTAQSQANRGGGTPPIMTNAALGLPDTVDIKVTMDTAGVDTAVQTIQTQINGLTSGDNTVKIPFQLDMGQFSEQVNGIGLQLGALSLVQTKIPVEIDLTSFNTSVMAVGMALQAITLVQTEVPVTMNAEAFFTTMTSVGGALNAISQTTYSVTLATDTGTFFTDMTAVGGALNALSQTTYTATLSTAGFDVSAQNAIDLKAVLDAVVGTYTGTLSVTNFATSAQRAIDLKALLDAVVGTYTATVSVSGAGTATAAVAGLLLVLRAVDGFVATSTVRQNTVQTTTRQVVDLGVRNLKAFADGGWASRGDYALVGENGPELVYFGQNAYVYTAPETENITETMANRLSANNATSMMGHNNNSGSGVTNVGEVRSGDTFNFYGDITIGTPEAATDFFREVDQRSGREVQLANRGMRPVDGMRKW